jgi:polyisoprenoid-binding protein YceI
MRKIVGVMLSGVVAAWIGAGTCWATDYSIDSSHSSIGFKVKHLAISSVPGTFSEFKGTFSYDPANVAASKAEAEITVKSIDTSDAKRDDHLRAADFFDAPKYPTITFKSKKVEGVSASDFKAHGDLTIHGVTKPVVLDVTYGGSAVDPWGKERAAFVATTKINRKDFGLTWSKTLETGSLVVGDEVSITLEIEGIKA